MANHRRVGADYGEAMELARAAAAEADRAGRDDLRARALGLEGVARAKRGEFDEPASRRSATGSRSRSPAT